MHGDAGAGLAADHTRVFSVQEMAGRGSKRALCVQAEGLGQVSRTVGGPVQPEQS